MSRRSLLLLSLAGWLLLSVSFFACCPCRKTSSLQAVANLKGGGNAFITKEEADTMRWAFEVYHRNSRLYDTTKKPLPRTRLAPNGMALDGDDSLSMSVWFDKNVITYLGNLLADSANLDGLRIYFGSYEKNMGVAGQKYAHQATVYMVPTRHIDDTTHLDNYEVIKALFLKQGIKQRSFLVTPFDAVNHGELCPSDCNVTSN